MKDVFVLFADDAGLAPLRPVYKDALRVRMFKEWPDFDEARFQGILQAHGLAGRLSGE